MKKETRIIAVICSIFLGIAVFLFLKQQSRTAATEEIWKSGQKETNVLADSLQKDSSSFANDDSNEEQKQTCAVYVSGAVKKPGLYHYCGTKRVGDAIHAVGGFKKNADRNGVNLARVLVDGEQINVYTKKQTKKMQEIANSSAIEKKVNINTATPEQLMTLPGIGESKAAAIIEYRTSNGSFQKVEDLMNISGIKEGVFEKIKARITTS